MKKISVLLLLLAAVLTSSSCSQKAITGDGKISDEYEWNTTSGLTDDSRDYSSNLFPESLMPSDEAKEEADKSHVKDMADDSEAVRLINTMGHIVQDGKFIEDAELFAKAVADANCELIGAYTGASADNYRFLEGVKITDYCVYPFKFSEEKELSVKERILGVEDCYMVSFYVEESENEQFAVGENVRFMAFSGDPVTGCRLCVFVAPELIDRTAFDRINTDFKEEIVVEFASLYAPRLADGEYETCELDFSESMHLISHLMKKSKLYNTAEPVEIDAVNSFIFSVFDGNAGISADIENLPEVWNESSVPIEVETENGIETQEIIYLSLCDMEHEKYVPEYIMTKTELENGTEYALMLFSDYSHFAVAKKMTFTFETAEGTLPRLVGVTQSDGTGNAVAYTVA